MRICSLLTAPLRSFSSLFSQAGFKQISSSTSALCQHKPSIILGIETSCDDTGVAVVNDTGQILGESLSSQSSTSVKFGGIVPSVSKILHEQQLDKVFETALCSAGLTPADLTAIAVTVKPGMTASLSVGLNKAKEIALKYQKPFIPIHHMESHALIARMKHKIDFPFLVLLASGGHCILAVGEDIDHWSVLGEELDNAPGQVFDRAARRLKVRNLEGFESISGGRAIEILAREGDHNIIPPPINILSKKKSANFSFAGLGTFINRNIIILECEQDISGSQTLPQIKDLCASLQYGVTRHLLRQTHKAMNFIKHKNLISHSSKSMVLSGGVACNLFIQESLRTFCNKEGYDLYVPPNHLCTDNGVMIAWNGIERWRRQKGILYTEEDISKVTFEHACPMGINLSDAMIEANLKTPKTEM